MIERAFILSFLMTLLITPALQSQELLNLEEAIRITLENNHQIRLRKIDAEITAKQVHPAMVGRRPTIDLNASYELGYSDARIETLAGGVGGNGDASPTDLDGISNDIVIGPELNLVLFDGGAGRYRLDQLSTSNAIAQLQLRNTTEQAIANVTNTYLQMAQEQSLLDIARQNITLTQNRLDRAIQDAEYGLSGSLQQLQIEVDLRADSAALRNRQLAYENARRNLNRQMGRATSESFVVNGQLTVVTDLSLPELEKALRQNNTSLKIGNEGIKMAAIDLQLSNTAFKPTIQGYANLNYAYLQDKASFLQTNRVLGPNVGVRLQVPLFDGGARRIKKESAVLSENQKQLEQQDIEAEMVKELQNTFATYQNTLEQWRIEKGNLRLFERNLENLQNRFLLGTATNTEVRTAQLNLNATLNRISNYQYTIKQAEVMLYLLSGKLLNNPLVQK